MLISTSNYLTAAPLTKDTEKINSIKLDFTKIYFATPSNHGHTSCKHCSGILTEEDRSMPKLEKNGRFFWNCRFCKGDNESQALYFVENNYKVAIQKNLKSKITPPILLFLIDNSGSMYQSIFHTLKYGSNPQVISQAKREISPAIGEMLRESTIYRQEREFTSKLKSQYTQLAKQKKYSEEEFSKIQLLYAVIEHNLKTLAKKDQIRDYRLGFIFFSDMLYLLKAAKQKQIPVYVNQGALCHQEWPYQKNPINFNSYQQLYQAGTTYEKYFGDSKLRQFEVSKVAVNKVKGGGMTALGPALALAMGIISKHDQGSRIIVATDSEPNLGVLANHDSAEVYERIGNCLSQNGATLSILKWSGDEMLKVEEQKSFGVFKKVYRDYVEQIELNLSKCKDNQSLEASIRSLNSLIHKRPMGNSCEVKVQCDNPKLLPEKLKIDVADYKNIRFLNNRSQTWFSLAVKPTVLQEYDFLFPVITQSITTYVDIAAKQRYLFMSYTRHHLLRQGPQNNAPPEELALMESFNLENLNELCNLQLLDLYERRQTQNIEEMKTNFKYKDIEIERDIKNCNDIAALKSQSHYEDEEDDFQHF